MFPTQNGTGILFIPAYIDHGSTSGQSNGTSRCCVSSRWTTFSCSNRKAILLPVCIEFAGERYCTKQGYVINKPVCQCTVTYVISVVHSVLVVIVYIVEYCTCIKLKMAKRKLQTELSLQQKSEVCCAYRNVRVSVSLPNSMAFQRRQLQTLRKMNTPL